MHALISAWNAEIKGTPLPKITYHGGSQIPDIEGSSVKAIRKPKPEPFAVLATYLPEFKSKDPVLAQELTGISKGYLDFSRPFHMLRERLIKDANGSRQVPADVTASLMVQAWNAERTGKQLRRLVASNSIPAIL